LSSALPDAITDRTMSPGEERSGLGVLAPPVPLPLTARARAGEPFPLLYRTVRVVAAPILHSLFRFRASGLEHLPSSGPFIVAANHHNYLDGIVLGVAIPRPISFLVMPRVFRASPLHPPFHRHLGSIPINVERPDPGAIKRALQVLRDGRVVGIFPEGPFSREGRLVPGQPGVAVIALRAGVPVVPAAIRGTYEALAGRRLYVPRRHPLSVRFGAPLHFGPTGPRGGSHGDRHEVTRRIMSEIAALLDAVPAARRESAAPVDGS